jgi:allantoate deiminase
MILAERLPIAMLFLRSPGGLSHHPDESVLPQDVEAALATAMEFLERSCAMIERIPKETHA